MPINNPYASLDPFRDINRQLRAVGISPLNMGPLQFPDFTQQQQRRMQDAAIVRERNAPHMYVNPVLSGLEWTGRKLDSLTGLRGIKGLLAGKPREALSAIPILGTFGDELGVTDPEQYTDASELLKPLGLEDSLVAGIATDVVLDPLTWLTLGSYGAAKGVAKAGASASGKALGKTGALKPIIEAAKTKRGAEALGLSKPMGPSQAMMNLQADAILKRDSQGVLDDIMGYTPDQRVADVSPIANSLESAGYDLDTLIKPGETLGSWGAAGLPFRKKPLPFTPGGRGEQYASLMDSIGNKMAKSKPFAFARNLFSPTAGGAIDPTVQDNLTQLASTTSRVEQQIDDQMRVVLNALEEHPETSAVRIREAHPDWSDSQVREHQRNNIYTIVQNIEGYDYDDIAGVTRRTDDAGVDQLGVASLPDYTRDTIEKTYARLADSIAERQKDLGDLADKTLVDDKSMLAGLEKIEGQTAANVGRAIERLSVISEGTGRGYGPQYFIQGGVHNRQAAQLPDHLKDLEPVISAMKQNKDAIFSHGVESGLQMDYLQDSLAKHIPRQRKNIPALTLRERFRKVRQSRQPGVRTQAADANVETMTMHQLQREDALKEIFGGQAGVQSMWNDVAHLEGHFDESAGELMRETIDRFSEALLKEGGHLDTLRKIASGTDEAFQSEMSRLVNSRVAPDPSVASRVKAAGLERQIGRLQEKQDMAKRAVGDFTTKSVDEFGNEIFEFSEDAVTSGKLSKIAAFFATQDPLIKEYGSPFVMDLHQLFQDYSRQTIAASNGARMVTSLLGSEAVLKIGSNPDISSNSILDMLNQWFIRTPVAKARVLGAMDDNVLQEVVEKVADSGELFTASRGRGLQRMGKDEFHTIVRERFTGNEVAKHLESLKNLDGFNMSRFERQMDAVLSNLSVPAPISDSIGGYMRVITQPESISKTMQYIDALTDFFKTSFTTPWPAFHSRNAISAAVNNIYAGATLEGEWNPIKRFLEPYRMTRQLLRGQAIDGIKDRIPQFKNMSVDSTGRAVDDAYVTDWLRSHIRSQRLSGGGVFREELIGEIRRGDIGTVLPTYEIPGRVPFKERFSSTLRRQGDWDQRGMGRRSVHAMREVGNEVESYARIAPFIAFLSQGDEVAEAARKVKLAQVDYQALSPFERRVMRRLIPFYTFTRRQIPFVFGNLMDQGPMSQSVRIMGRAKSRSRDPNRPEPDWLSNTLALAIPGGPEGKQRYVTNLGGFIGGAEDVLNLINPGRTPMDTVSGSVRGILGRTHPLIQMPIEAATGYSLFAGRPLSELTPPTAKLIQQVTGSESLPSTPGPLAEVLLQRIPGYGRAVSTLRTLTDPNRPISGEQGSLLNLAARLLPATIGIRIKDVDLDRIKYRLQQESIEAQLRENPNVRSFTHIYIPDDVLATMSEEEQAMYALYKQLQSEASKASRQRAKEEEGIQTPPAAAPQSPRSSGGSLRYLQRPVSELVNDAIGRPLL